MKNDIGIVTPRNNIGTAGVAFVVVPEGISREEYIENCYRTNTICMNGGLGYGDFYNVPVDSSVMQLLEFPTNVEQDKRGTAVVWVKDTIHNVPVVVACLRKQDNYYSLEEYQHIFKKETDSTSVVVFTDGSTSKYNITVVGNKDNPGNVDIKITSENEDSVFNIYCDNEVNIVGNKSVNIATEKELNCKFNKDGETKTEIRYNREEGFFYKDEFGNEINCKDGEINIISDKINHNNGNEPMVLGDKLETLLNDMLDAIMQLTVVTPVGASSVPVNTAVFGQIKARVNQIKSSKSNLD